MYCSGKAMTEGQIEQPHALHHSSAGDEKQAQPNGIEHSDDASTYTAMTMTVVM